MRDEDLRALARRLTAVPGVRAVVLGGSRARGHHGPGSDVDLGLYYDEALDLAALGSLARDIAGPDATVSAPGGWGPWVDGGAWLEVDGVALDWIYRDLRRVRTSCDDAVAGHVEWYVQAGHPFGWPSHGYAAEVATAVVLDDPDGVLETLRDLVTPYPPALETTLVDAVWEAGFLVQAARKSAARADATHVALCLSRAFLVCAQALLARDRTWVTNEKGAIALAGSALAAPDGFAADVAEVLGCLGTTPPELAASVDRADRLVASTRTTCEPSERA